MATRLLSPQVRAKVKRRHMPCYRDSLPTAVRANGLVVSAGAYRPVRRICFTASNIKKAPDLRQRLDASGQRPPEETS